MLKMIYYLNQKVSEGAKDGEMSSVQFINWWLGLGIDLLIESVKILTVLFLTSS